MNRFSHVDLAAPPFPPRMRGGRGGTLMPVIAGARCGASSVMKVREGARRAEPVEATKSRSASLTSLG